VTAVNPRRLDTDLENSNRLHQQERIILLAVLVVIYADLVAD
jgi:hypothetical protein